MSKPLNLEEIEFKILFLEKVKEDLLRAKCEEGALAISGVIHAYKKVIGILDKDMDMEK